MLPGKLDEFKKIISFEDIKLILLFVARGMSFKTLEGWFLCLLIYKVLLLGFM